MTKFFEKAPHLTNSNEQLWQFGYDFSVSGGDDDYDFYDLMDDKNMMGLLIDDATDFVKDNLPGSTIGSVYPYPFCKDYGGGDGYVKIMLTLK
jgi:hypothetical protein